MAKNNRYSRLSPAYLARRHAGTVFLFLALGLCAGVAYRMLLQPSRYSAEAEVALTVLPEEDAARFDWDAKQRDWNALFDEYDGGHGGDDEGDDVRALLGSNLRHALKLAATAEQRFDVNRLSGVLAGLAAGESFSASLFQNPALARFAPAVEVRRDMLAANLDHQSLAVIAADLDPAPGVEGWDFSFFAEFLPETQEKAVVAFADAEDPYFRVFFTLHRLLRGGEAPTADIARLTTEGEVLSRLDREAQFNGGGGFGPAARRELLREVNAVPVLAANALYAAADWRKNTGGNATRIELTRQTPDRGTVRVRSAVLLHPLRFPRDTVLTRTPPLTVSTVLATLAARENHAVHAAPAHEPATMTMKTPPAAPAPAPVPAPEPTPAPAPEPAPAAEAAESVIITYREEIDEVANAARLAHIDALEKALLAAARDREACLRRLETARGDETILSVEAMNARARADRLSKRRDEASVLIASRHDPKIPEETRALLRRRDDTTRRLNELLAYCTTEHPFVIAAFRELEAVEAALGEYAHTKNPESDELTDALATRAANLYVEWESASDAADALEERRARQAEAIACLVEELENIEASRTKREDDLAAARAAPVPTRRIAEERPLTPPPAPKPVPGPEPAIPAPAPEPVPAPPAPSPEPEAEPAPRLAFAPVPHVIPLAAERPGWTAACLALACGCALGLLVSLLRELLTRRFSGPWDARRLVKLPVLASLPAYDAKSFRRAAATVKGEVTGKSAGALQFIPSPVELFEPPTEARRGRVLPLKRAPRVLAWACGILLVFAAVVLYYQSTGGIAQPAAAFAGELPLPGLTVPAWTESRSGEGEWGDKP